VPSRPGLLVAVVLGFVGFVTSFGAHIVAVNLPFYAQSVGVGVAVIGLLIAAYDLAEIIAKPSGEEGEGWQRDLFPDRGERPFARRSTAGMSFTGCSASPQSPGSTSRAPAGSRVHATSGTSSAPGFSG
jgi:hypothetical protein